MTTRLQQTLIRQLEGQLRQCGAITDIRWQLTQTGMTKDEVWAVELPIRRQIRSERAGRKPAGDRAAQKGQAA